MTVVGSIIYFMKLRMNGKEIFNSSIVFKKKKLLLIFFFFSMHLMKWMRISQPKMWERALITIVQGGFYNAFFALYLLSPRTAHRVVGYLEEEAIISYTSFLNGLFSHLTIYYYY